MKSPATEFVPSEYGGAAFGDERLSLRLCRIAHELSAQPSASFPDAFEDASQLEGFYRFIDNKKVTPLAVLEPHIKATLKRMHLHDEIIVAHDTTEGRFEGEVPRKGCGPLAGGGHGFMAHVALGIGGDPKHREPVGILGLHTWIRQQTDLSAEDKKRKQKKSRPDSESKRWLEMVQSVQERVAQMERPARLIHVMDREGDFYELLATLVQDEVLFVVRRQHDRVLHRVEGKSVRMSDVLKDAPLLATREVRLSRRARSSSPKDRAKHPPREARPAKLAISSGRVEVPATPGVSELELPASIGLNVVIVREVEPPPGEEPVDWYLLTPLPVETPRQVLRVVDIYRARWMIEELFKALKTGCEFEKRQLETLEHLLNALAVLLPIAWQLLRMRHLSRQDESMPATEVFTPQQLQVLDEFVPGLPEEPTVKEALLAVAKLGGHLKSNGEPGWLVLGRGYQKLLALEAGWAAARKRRPSARRGGKM